MTKNAQINAYPTADKKAPLRFYVYLNTVTISDHNKRRY